MLSYSKQHIEKEDIEFVKKSMLSELLTQGSLIKKFENKLSIYFKSKYCVAVSSGTAALHLCGIALNWSKNDIILLSANTFVATANSALYSKAKIDLVDINQKTNNIDPSALENKILIYRKNGKKINTVIATDYAGHPCDWIALHKLKKKYGFHLINDNCHAIGSEINKDRGYAIKYADFVVHSYHPVKAITTGEGGSIFTNSKKYFDILNKSRSHGIIRNKFLFKKFGEWYYDINSLGYNYRMSEINSALGLSQLKKLNKFISRRRKIANLYHKNFEDFNLIDLPIELENYKHSYHLFILKFDFYKHRLSKKKFFQYMLKKKIKLQVHYVPIYEFSYFKENFNFNKKDFINCNKFYHSAFSIPNYYGLTDKEINFVSNEIKDYFIKNI